MPEAPDSSVLVDTPGAPMLPAPTASSGHILLVDDDDDFREAVARVLLARGYQVTQAGHGRLALDALAAGPGIGVIILDLMMPIMDGLSFLAHKARGAFASLPVIIFSSSEAIGLDAY